MNDIPQDFLLPGCPEPARLVDRNRHAHENIAPQPIRPGIIMVIEGDDIRAAVVLHVLFVQFRYSLFPHQEEADLKGVAFEFLLQQS